MDRYDYQPERIRLGKILEKLGRRPEATILAWNFFTDFGSDGEVGTASEYRPEHIEGILEQLRTSYVDILVLCQVKDQGRRQQQEELLADWQKRGYVRSLGLWVPDAEAIRHYRESDVYRLAVRPFNVITEADASAFAACKMPGREMFATSPFHRGWELDRLLQIAATNGLGETEELRGKLADRMLRFSMYGSGADRVIIGMRKLDWVRRNLASVAKGPLTAEEQEWLGQIRKLGARKTGWRRLRSFLRAGRLIH